MECHVLTSLSNLLSISVTKLIKRIEFCMKNNGNYIYSTKLSIFQFVTNLQLSFIQVWKKCFHSMLHKQWSKFQMHLFVLKCTCHQKNIFWYVKGTHFRSPLHQHSVKNIHQVIKKKCISKFRVWEGDYQFSAQIVPIIPANNAGVV